MGRENYIVKRRRSRGELALCSAQQLCTMPELCRREAQHDRPD